MSSRVNVNNAMSGSYGHYPAGIVSELVEALKVI